MDVEGPPPIVREFAARCRQLLERDGTLNIRPVTYQTHRTLSVPPLWMHSMGGDDGLFELYVSLPGPMQNPGMRFPIYEEGPRGHKWDQVMIEMHMTWIRRRLILEELSEIDPDDG